MPQIEFYKGNSEWEKSEFSQEEVYAINLTNPGEAIILKIYGSRHTLYWDGSNNLTIGCLTHSIDHWVANVLQIASENGYTEEQGYEYQKYVELVALVFNSNK